MRYVRDELVGIGLLILFNLLSSAKEVYVGHLVQQVSPVAVMTCTFTLAALFFLLLEARSFRDYLRSLREHPRDVALLNVTTLGSWLTFFLALKYLEPAIISAVAFAIGPLLTVALWPWLRRGRPSSRGELLAAIGIVAGVGVLLATTWVGRSAVGHLAVADAVKGLTCTLICGVAVVANTFVSKRLSEGGLTARRIVALRFFLLIAAGFALWPRGASGATFDGPFLLAMLVIAVAGVIVPLYVVQLAIEKCEPITVSLLLAAVPIFSFFLQIFDPRLKSSLYSLAGVAVCVLFTAVGVVARPAAEKTAQ